MSRSTTEVIEDHLQKRLHGDVEGDISTNFAENVVILSGYGIFHGHDGIRASAAKLQEMLGSSRYSYKRVLIEGEYGYLEWNGSSDDEVIKNGADSYVVRNGKIVAQTIHYTGHSKP